VANNEPSFSDEGTEGPTTSAAVGEAPQAAPETERRKGRGSRKRDGAGTDKRERILRAAIRVFARKGFYSTRVSEIAKAAGVADGTIYLYFKNKDDVLISIFQDRISKLLEALSTAIAEQTSFEAKLRACVDLQLGLLDGSRELAEVVTVNLRQSSRLLKQYGAPLFGRYLETISGVFEEGQTQGIVREDLSPRVLARALWGALDAIALGWALGGGDDNTLKRGAQQVAITFLDGVRTPS
jgi:TetR/AcrR family transcriptional regulator, fatty acid metabolism regulator protein